MYMLLSFPRRTVGNLPPEITGYVIQRSTVETAFVVLDVLPGLEEVLRVGLRGFGSVSFHPTLAEVRDVVEIALKARIDGARIVMPSVTRKSQVLGGAR
jgi:hypothetical protein